MKCADCEFFEVYGCRNLRDASAIYRGVVAFAVGRFWCLVSNHQNVTAIHAGGVGEAATTAVQRGSGVVQFVATYWRQRRGR